jgi:glutathione S-transferase
MLKLVIGNKTYSSWSLRAWLLLVEANIPFEEVFLSLFTPEFSKGIHRYTPAGRVPVLLDVADGGETFAVWDTLAIAEYLAERFPDKALWPVDAKDRARARSICAEMHSGFGTLRGAWPMNVTATNLRGMGWSIGVQNEVDRLCAMWTELLDRHGGPMLFGRFTIADAFFAPIVSRLATYGAEVPVRVAQYRDAVLALGGVQRWIAEARNETTFLVEDEPYRRAP